METANPKFNDLAPCFHDPDAARELVEAIRWPDGPVCPHCGVIDRAYKLTPKPGSKRPVRPGVYKCRDCRRQFTVTVGTVFEKSLIPLSKWVYLVHLMTAAKKGVSAHQVHRLIGVDYKTAWFMCHRLRKAMEEGPLAELLSGVVEADETYVGGKAKKGTGGGGPTAGGNKTIVFSLVERDGKARSQVVTDVTGDNLKGIIREEVDRSTRMMTDGLESYRGLGAEYAEHGVVEHSAGEYVKGDWHTNTAESYFSLFKRGVIGSFHHLSRKHMHRYLAEFDFRWSRRKDRDGERFVAALAAITGKRLFYRTPKLATV